MRISVFSQWGFFSRIGRKLCKGHFPICTVLAFSSRWAKTIWLTIRMDAYFFENEQKNRQTQVVEGLVNLVPRVLSYPPYGCLSLHRAGRREPWERGWGLVSTYYLLNIFLSPTELPTCPTTKGSINSPRAALTIITLVTGAETQTHFFYILFLVNFFNHFRCRIRRDKRKLH